MLHHPSGCQSVNVPCAPPLVTKTPPPKSRSSRSSRSGSLLLKSVAREAIAELAEPQGDLSPPMSFCSAGHAAVREATGELPDVKAEPTPLGEVQQPSGHESNSSEAETSFSRQVSGTGSCAEAEGPSAEDAVVTRAPMQRRRRPSLTLSLTDENTEPEVCRADQHGKKHGKDTPRSLTDAALLKSQLLLDELEQLGLLQDLETGDLPVEASAAKQMCESDMSTSASLSDGENSSESSTAEAARKLDVVQVPAELLEMLATMWQELQHLRSKDDSAVPLLEEHLLSKGDLPEKRFDSWPLPKDSMFPLSPGGPISPGTMSTMTPRDSLIISSSTDAGSSLLGSIKTCSSYTTRSLGSCSTSCSTLSQEDKNLLKELRDLLRHGMPSKLATAALIQRGMQPVHNRVCIPLAARPVPMHVVKTTTIASSPLQLHARPAAQTAPAVQAVSAAQAPTRFVHPRRSVLV